MLFQRCTWCGTAMYHRLLCPVCQGSDLRTERSEGVGTVRHSTVLHRNTPAARNVSLIEMAEGFVVRGRVMGPPIGIHSGDRVRLSTAKDRSEEHTSELQSRENLVCRLLLEKKKNRQKMT